MTWRRAVPAATLTAALAVCAFGAPSASAVSLHACEETKAGATAQEYTSATCETKGVGKYRTVPIGDETLTSPTVIGNQVISATIEATTVEIVCKSMSGSGKGESFALIEGEEEVQQAFVKEFKIKYFECTVAKPVGGGCVLKAAEPPIETKVLRLEGRKEAGGNLKAWLYTENGTDPIANITLEKCSKAGLNGTRELDGEMRAILGTDPSVLEFTTTSGTSLTLGKGNPASYTGDTRLFMEGTTKRMAFALP
jgi:hypothetical protein